MSKGIMLGLLMQLISATGYMVIVNVTSIKSEWFRTGLMICSAGIVALVVTGYTVFSGQQQLSAIPVREYVIIAIGSIMVMFVAQALFFFAVGLMAKPMLVTLPIVLLLFDYWPLRRFNLSKSYYRHQELSKSIRTASPQSHVLLLILEKVPGT